MEYERKDDKLNVRLMRDFNLYTAGRVLRLSEGASRIEIDLTRSKFVDSEALRALYRMIHAGKHVTLINPPKLFGEVLDILELRVFFDEHVNTRTRRKEAKRR